MGEAAKTSLTSSADVDQSARPQHGTLPQNEKHGGIEERGRVCRFIDALSYVPPNCRYDPKKPFQFSIGLNVLFGRASRFTAWWAEN